MLHFQNTTTKVLLQHLRSSNPSSYKPFQIDNLAADKTHRPACRNKCRVVDMVTRFFFHHNVLDKADDLLTRSAASDEIAEVVFGGGEQAGADLAVGG